jgi:CRP/FNR family cyclic AMP-dependent transcriptional regulator
MYSKYLADQQYKIVTYRKGEMVYEPGQHPRYVYFVKTGEVRMFTVSDDGKEFTQGVFKARQYFGEPALLLQRPYLAFTVALKDTELIQLDVAQFRKMIEDNKEFSMELILTLSDRLFYKSMMLEELASEQADHRLRTLIDYLCADLQQGEALNITRQALADRSGLRVETVIRTLKKMAAEGSVKLIRGKIVKMGL